MYESDEVHPVDRRRTVVGHVMLQCWHGGGIGKISNSLSDWSRILFTSKWRVCPVITQLRKNQLVRTFMCTVLQGIYNILWLQGIYNILWLQGIYNILWLLMSKPVPCRC